MKWFFKNWTIFQINRSGNFGTKISGLVERISFEIRFRRKWSLQRWRWRRQSDSIFEKIDTICANWPKSYKSLWPSWRYDFTSFFLFQILIGIFWFHEFFCFFLGQNGQKGLNLLTRHSDQVIVNLGGKSSVNVEAGDIFTLKTPGGGGWGNPLPVW